MTWERTNDRRTSQNKASKVARRNSVSPWDGEMKSKKLMCVHAGVLIAALEIPLGLLAQS